MLCKKCGNNVKSDFKYCPYCGAEILSGAFSFCPSCGESLPVLAQPAAEKAPGKPSPQREKAKKERPRKRATAQETEATRPSRSG